MDPLVSMFNALISRPARLELLAAVNAADAAVEAAIAAVEAAL